MVLNLNLMVGAIYIHEENGNKSYVLQKNVIKSYNIKNKNRFINNNEINNVYYDICHLDISASNLSAV